MRFAIQTLTLLLAAATMASAMPVDKRNDIQEREELYPYPDLGRIKGEDKREELYPYPDLGRIKVEDKREELYPYPDLGRIKVEDK